MPTGARDLDPHRKTVYAWEDSWPGWNRNHITTHECRSLIRCACGQYKVPCPTVIVHPQRSMSWSIPPDGRISIQGGAHKGRGGRNVATSLHEAAHHIAWTLHGERIQDHGRTFLRIYLDLLVRARVAPQIALEASAKAHGLRWK